MPQHRETRPGILFLSHSSEWTGPAQSLLLLLRHLRSVFSVEVYLPGEGEFSEILKQEGIPYSASGPLRKSFVFSFSSFIRRKGFELIYANTSHGGSANALLAAKIAGVPFLCHLRAMADGRPRRRFLFLNFADELIACSQACAKSMRGRVWTPTIHVIPNGVDLQDFPPVSKSERASIRTQLGVSERDTLVLNVGHVKPLKGQHFLLEALARLKDFSNLRALVVGRLERDAEYVRQLDHRIRQLDMTSRFALVGFRKEIPAILAGADIFVHTSLEEVHPRAILEAMAAGLPVVAFSVGGIPETIEHERTGILIEPGNVDGLCDALRFLNENPEAREGLGVSARRAVEERYCADSTAAHVEKVIRKALKNGSGRT